MSTTDYSDIVILFHKIFYKSPEMNQRLTRRGLESEASGTVIGFAPGVAEESWFSRILEVGLGLGDGLGEGLGDGSGEGLGEGVGITGFGTGGGSGSGDGSAIASS
jgi:hypothetical protein